MKKREEKANPIEAIVSGAAHCVGRLQTGMLVLVWSGMAGFCVAVASLFLANLNDHTGNPALDGMRTVALMVVGRLEFLVLPVGVTFAWLLVERQCAQRSCAKLHALVLNGADKEQPHLTSARVGALLDMIMATGTSAHVGSVPTTLLDYVLRLGHAEEEITLTSKQRSLLHEFLIQGYWRREWFNVFSGPEIKEDIRCQLRPAVIASLSLLGDASSILALERFAGKTANPNLRQSALLSIEQIRKRLQYGPEQMLRASAAPEHPDTLLRAAYGDKPQATDLQQLLRAENAAINLQDHTVTKQTNEQTTPVPNRVK